MEIKNPELKQRIIEISHKKKLSHLGSCLTAVDIINDIYDRKRPEDKFVLSAGHAALALYVVLEKFEGHDAEELFEKHGVHPNKDEEHGIWVSTGSLGQGITVATGMALADRKRKVYCLITDGEAHEGAVYEALNYVYDTKLTNLVVLCNWNGYTAYRSPSDMVRQYLEHHPAVEIVETDFEFDFLNGLDAHYITIGDTEYQVAKDLLNVL